MHITFTSSLIYALASNYQNWEIMYSFGALTTAWKNFTLHAPGFLDLPHPPLPTRGSRFSCKNGGVVYRSGGDRHCFSLIRYGFCGSNVLYSAGLSFRMFIFLLTPFDTWDCYYFRLNLSSQSVAYKSCL